MSEKVKQYDMTVDVPRETALKIIYAINEKGAYSNIAVNKHLKNSDMRETDRAFTADLVYGTVKWRLTLDWIIGQFSRIRPGKISPWILNILRMGIYQLLYTDKIPVSAACNESVNLAKKYGHAASAGFVNGILRNVARSRNEIRYPDKEADYVRFLSVKHSHPEWMVEMWIRHFGIEFTESLLESNNSAPAFTVRINAVKASRKELMEALWQEGIESANGKYLEESLVIFSPSAALKSGAFKEGLFQVQDESSMLAARVLDPKPGELVMDVCAAPGGKATHIAEIMEDRGTVVAWDVHEHKIKLIEDACGRLGLRSIKTNVFDATAVDDKYLGKADRVLVDAPCTGLGIIRRKPDIKWSRNTGDLSEITRMQTSILNAASRYVKPGGILVYSTCTINPAENGEVVEAFLEENAAFEPDDISPFLPEVLRSRTMLPHSIQLFPNTDGVDGFFISRMKKVGDNA